ncbi:unnamed protein product [Schistosoma curassoni]|uniref:Uncharacterized protein n=1 Tax=Schistosoma curassoni TaxID=6186 RepID=A0A183KW26_9TREM|nr:unnamed protein product [Schistosoma curassoni]
MRGQCVLSASPITRLLEILNERFLLFLRLLPFEISFK